jgi:hypothetical protein
MQAQQDQIKLTNKSLTNHYQVVTEGSTRVADCSTRDLAAAGIYKSPTLIPAVTATQTLVSISAQFSFSLWSSCHHHLYNYIWVLSKIHPWRTARRRGRRQSWRCTTGSANATTRPPSAGTPWTGAASSWRWGRRAPPRRSYAPPATATGASTGARWCPPMITSTAPPAAPPPLPVELNLFLLSWVRSRWPGEHEMIW